MTKRKRIAALEAAVETLTARIAMLEAQPYQTWMLPANSPFIVPTIYPTAPQITWGTGTAEVPA
jgi:hypothetical protein